MLVKSFFRTSYSKQVWLSSPFVQVLKAVVNFFELYPISKILETMLLDTIHSQHPDVLK